MANFQAQIPHKNTDLSPILSQETVDYHFGRHHKGYASTLNSLVENTKYDGLSLEEIIEQSRGADQKIFNNAAQLFNHDFYWKCLKTPNGADACGDKLQGLVTSQFGSFDEFLQQYISFANAMFGSGWCWLVWDGAKLSFSNAQNAETPVGTGQKPICVIDLWEHSYYIDYRNNRAEYIERLVKECINWDFVLARLRENRPPGV